ncbi:phosphopantetheine adenylyltransferase [Variovorax terrae]|uniref:Phosphopantetheine adenylyltransferase n=1 Tax=Variovorax terrae TaxID=2923278 RepID=A0A9X2ANN9_9BURK|nr:phosphopantetheine adenylyltransferase [Variovorax terrae]MCJ0763970.1 phosphopantetheine adenylyltransferase [Variovorax terrae]
MPGIDAMRYFIAATLLLTGIIHLLPLSGVAGPERLSALYGIPVAEPNLEILLRHRAVLFGLLGAFLVYAAFCPQYQAIGFVAGLASVVSFVLLAVAVGGYNAPLARVVFADMLALVLLVAGGAALLLSRRGA